MLRPLITDFSKPFASSVTQLVVAGLALYWLSMFIAPAYGCQSDTSQIIRGAFACQAQVMPGLIKVLIISGIALGSLCWGRAVCLLEGKHA